MTDEQKLRELDAWIAEHVMGWHGINCGGIEPLGFPESVQSRAPMYNEIVLRYTTDPAAAMEVLEKCQSRMDCEDIALGECCGSWSAYSIFRENKGVIGRIHVFVLPPEKLTLPLAIALFAKQLFSKE